MAQDLEIGMIPEKNKAGLLYGVRPCFFGKVLGCLREGAAGFGGFFIVTPRLLTTPGFPPIRDRHGGLCPPYAYPSLRSIRAVRDGSDASSLSRLACSQRLASLRFGTKPGGFAPLGFIPHFAPSSLLTTARTLLLCHASQPAAVPRLPCDSGQTRPVYARPGLCPSLQSIRGAAGFGRFYINTSRPCRGRRGQRGRARAYRPPAPRW